MQITNDKQLADALAWLADNVEPTPERSEAIVQYWTKPGQFMAEGTPEVEEIFAEWNAETPENIDVNDYAEEFWHWVGSHQRGEPQHFYWQGNGDVYWLWQVGQGESVREALEAWAAEIAEQSTAE